MKNLYEKVKSCEAAMESFGEIFESIHNYFETEILSGVFQISLGSIAPDFLTEGQIFRVVGSARNNGVWIYPCADMADEQFEGEIWLMAPPKSMLNLCTEIIEWKEKNRASGPYQSESFKGYSYQIATNSKGIAVSWQDVFADRLKKWRKLL